MDIDQKDLEIDLGVVVEVDMDMEGIHKGLDIHMVVVKTHDYP